MEYNNDDLPPRSFRDLDTEARVRELGSLQEQLRKPEPITHLQLSEWVSGSDNRVALLAGTVWGGIRWAKTLGRPKTPSITGGFTIVHEFKRVEYVDKGGGDFEDVSKWKVQPAPSVWDASTADSSEYRVAFFFFAGGGGINPNRLTVQLSDVQWEKSRQAGTGYRRLNPFGYSSFGNLGERLVLPDFIVERVRYSRAPYILPLGPAVDAELYREQS